MWNHVPETEDEDEIDEHIANIILKTDLHTSVWADELLYFRHRPVHLDRKFWSRGLKRLDEDVKFN